MTEKSADNAAPIGTAGLDSLTAGAMLRAAREKRGLHIAALAASIKVSPRKLEALEADRYAELPDLTFTRALAQTVCRALKIDAETVLAKLPQAGDLPKLAKVGGALNTPFREAAGKRDPSEFALLRKPVFWATLVVLLAALALALWPERWMPWRSALSLPAWAPSATTPAASPASSAVTIAPAGVAVAVAVPLPALAASSAAEPTSEAPTASVPAPAMIETVHSAPPPALAGSAPGTAAAAGVLSVRTNAESWVEVQDGRGQMLLSRTVQPGESIGLDGALPLRLTIGNATATQVVFRGKPVDLVANTRDNIARLQLP